MILFVLRRIGVMILTALCMTMIVFALTNLRPNLEKIARTEAGSRITDEQVTTWLGERGFLEPMPIRYGQWLGVVPGWTKIQSDGSVTGYCINRTQSAEDAPRYCGVLQGEWGYSRSSRDDVASVLTKRLGATGVLMFWVMIIMIPSALIIGIFAGMREGSRTDRALSTASIAATATPEYVSGVIFIALFASSITGISPILREWGVIDRTLFLASARSAYDSGPTFANFTLPVMTMAIYGMGYIARMTRASMAEVMTSQYIRTARLKGVSFRNIVIKHALRNALIAPFTVIMLQIPWLLTGVVIVESIFNYNGFGFTLVAAASNNDIELLLAMSVVAVFIVLVTQLISDIGYVVLNPRIRIS
ncbi:ABC transporter permease [Parasulfitobacter algicola]|uniref:ABC transporter permease n=1 Tax=Parasulfitobacter algicola TaxID=2614809 RepID=A0ABX2IR42_9RHOB|nr:ABC transporter permease [Sulfitobacter algicola]NSX55366.1 ABC transporter permease [Sulfitobacter algicola]